MRNTKRNLDLNLIKGVVVGHAVADALGVPVEFSWRDKLDENPVTDMVGFGAFPYPKGTWSDDTSMTLATMDAISGKKINYDAVMRYFVKWYYRGEYTPSGVTFDCGSTCVRAIKNYYEGGKPCLECGLADEYSNGNGSLMRIHPIVLYFADKTKVLSEKLRVIYSVSSLTHAHERTKIGCGIYAFVLWEIINNRSKTAIYSGLEQAEKYYEGNKELKFYSRLFDKDFEKVDRAEIQSSGYVVYTLEAAIWCLLKTDNYEDCVLKAVNLGRDTDTVAAVAGGLAGALYGYDAIPQRWKNALLRLDYIESLCEKLFKA